MVTVVENAHGDPKGMNPTISYGLIVGQIGLFNFGITDLGEGKTEFKPVKLRLKIYLLSNPARADGFLKTYM